MLNLRCETLGPLVLLVDDDAMIVAMLQVALERAGYRVLTAESGEAALKIFAACAVDAVALDYNLPGMNGGEAAKAMTRLRPAVPKLLFSSWTTLSGEERGYFQGYCAKPCGLRTFLAQIAKMAALPLSA